MKKIYLLLAVVMASVSAFAQCTIDPTLQTHPGIYPPVDSLPCIERGAAYTQTIQVQCETYFDSVINIPIVNTTYPIQLTVDSMILDSVIGLPSGITWVKNPNVLYGGQNGCLTFSGTTNDPAGAYPLAWYGTVWARLPNPIPAQYASQVYTGILNRDPWYNYHLHVIEPGDPCTPIIVNGITASDLKAYINVFPNPSNGVINLKVDAGSALSGTIAVSDVSGRIIYANKFDVSGALNTSIDLSAFSKGVYFLQIKSSKGFAARMLNVE